MREMERGFWSQVDPKVFQSILVYYKHDLLFFEYSAPEYFKSLGMEDYVGLKASDTQL